MGLTVSEIDVHLITGKMKNGEAPGPGNINLELMKYSTRKVILLT
jgi:hypothetical protein